MDRQNIDDLFPLSPLQESVLLHEILAPEYGIYYEQYYFDINTEIELQVFEKALLYLINRHPILRAAFLWCEMEEPLKVIYKSVNLPFRYYDWRNQITDDLDEKFKMFIISERKKRFVFDQAPLIKCSLFQIRENRYRFVWRHHQLIMDGWSLPGFLKEIFETYDEYRKGTESLLTSDAAYQSFNDWIKKRDDSNAEKFWSNSLRGITSPTSVRPLASTEKITDNPEIIYEELSIKLPDKITDLIIPFIRNNNITMNTLMNGVWSLLLNIYSGDEDVIFGSAISGQQPDLKSIKRISGVFKGILPQRVETRWDDFIIPWLNKIHTDNLERDQFAHPHLTDIQRWSNIPRNMPFFKSIFVFENDLPDFEIVDESIEKTGSNTSISNSYELAAFEDTDYLFASCAFSANAKRIKIIFNPKQFDSIAVTSMLELWQDLLKCILENSDERLIKIKMLLNEKIPFDPNVNLNQNQKAEKSNVKQTFANICADVLGVENIDMNDNFFMIGGNSLIATQVVSRLRETYSVELPLEEIYEGENLAEISKKIETVLHEKDMAIARLREQIDQMSREEIQVLLANEKKISHQ